MHAPVVWHTLPWLSQFFKARVVVQLLAVLFLVSGFLSWKRTSSSTVAPLDSSCGWDTTVVLKSFFRLNWETMPFCGSLEVCQWHGITEIQCKELSIAWTYLFVHILLACFSLRAFWANFPVPHEHLEMFFMISIIKPSTSIHWKVVISKSAPFFFFFFC